MKLSLVKIAVLFFVFLTTTAFAQYQGFSYNFYGGGARSEGMGQAFLAVSNDGSAGSWNPAGLYIHEQTLMQFSYGSFMPRGDEKLYFDDDFDVSFLNNPDGPYWKIDHDGEYLGVGYWSLVSPIRVKGHHFVLNLSFTKHFDTYNTFAENLLYERLGWGPLPNTKLERHGNIKSINFGFGTRVNEKIAFGASANIYYGGVVSEEFRYLRAVLSDISGIDRVYRNSITVIDSTSYSGFNATLGFLYTSDPFRAGLSLRTPFNLKGESDTTMFYHATENGLPIDGSPFLTMFKSDTVYIDDMTSQLEMPLTIGLGLAYDVKENWTFAGDLEYRGFSGKKIKTLDSLLLTAGGERIEFFTDNDPLWSNVMQFRIGTEYRWESAIGIIPLRVGFRNEAFPEGNITSITTLYEGEKGSSENDSTRVFYVLDTDKNQITGYSISFGLGIHWSRVLIDLAYTNTRYSQDLYKEDGFLRLENSWNNHSLNMSFTGYF